MHFSTTGFFSRRSLNELLYVGLVLSVFAGYITYSLFQEHIRVEARERERLITQARVVAENLDSRLISTNLALASILREIPDWRRQNDGMKLAAQHMKALKDAMPGVLTLLLIDASGIVAASEKPDLVGRNVTQREYFKTVRSYPNPDTLYISVPFMTTRGNFTMNLVRMVPGPDGSFDGMVIAALDPNEFRILLSSVLYAPDMSASLIHGDGMLFLTSPDRQGVVGFDQEKPGSFFAQQLKSDQKANVFTGTGYASGDDSMVAMATVRPAALSMDKPLVIAAARDLQAVFADWRDDALKNGELFGFAALFAVLGLIYYQKQWRVFDADAVKHKSENQRTLAALRNSEEQFRSLTKLSSDWYWEQDEQFRFVRLHGKLDQRTSIANEAHVGKTRWEMGALNLTEADWDKHRAVLQSHQEFHDFEMQRSDKEGQLHWVSISGMPIFDAQGKFCGYRGVARDISLQKSAEDEVRRLAFHDSLTQLPNRRLFSDRLGHALAVSKRSGCYGALMFLDLDNFKPLNDLHGHPIGDLLLIEVARRMTGCVRKVDTVARFGGDEFAVILSELDQDLPAARSKAAIVAEKIHAVLAEPYVLAVMPGEDSSDSVTHRCTASMGVVLFMGHEATSKEILRRADMAMYQAKSDGRSLIRFHDSNTE